KGITHFVRVIICRGENGRYAARIAAPTEAYYSKWLQSANGIAVIGPDRGLVRANELVDAFLIGEI
ncbi:MAG: hypothetical protein ACREBS_08135, partial [Nitrososphaerales archaeon]